MSVHRPGSEGCREMFARLSEYLDGELDASLCRQFDVHMEDCPPCQAFIESLQRTVDLLGRMPRPNLTASQKRKIVEAYEKLKEPGRD